MERSAGRDRGRLGHLVPKSQGADLPNHGQGPQAVGTQSLQLSGNAGRHHPGDEGRAAMKWKDLRGEIAAHIEEKALELIESGVPQEEAWNRARREFGTTTLVIESSREAWPWTWLEHPR